MVVHDKRKEQEFFKDLEIGAFFIFDTNLHIKIDNDMAYDLVEEISFNIDNGMTVVTPISSDKIEITIKQSELRFTPRPGGPSK